MSNLRKATRQQAKIKINLQAPAGGGKTYSALLLAYGLTGNWEKIALIDTENGSGDLYADFGPYNVLPLSDHSKDGYCNAITECEAAGMEVIIIDSITHNWDWILAKKDSMSGNSYTNWAKLTPLHQAFVNKMLHSKCHIIATTRTKQDYILEENEKGKLAPKKVGMKGMQREGLDYEFTIVLDLDIKHNATASKDRTGLFMDKLPFVINEDTGKDILAWCNAGALPFINEARLLAVLSRIADGEKEVVEKAKAAYSFTATQLRRIEEAIEFAKPKESAQ